MSNQLDSENVYNITNIFLIISIGTLLACFTGKSYDLIANYQSITNIDCSYTSGPTTVPLIKDVNNVNYTYDETQQKINNCYDNKNKLEKNYANTKTTFMLVIGFIYLIIGIVLSRQMKSAAPIGISLGGFFLTMFYLIINWFTFTQQSQVLIMGCLLAGMIYFGISKFNLTNLTNISIEPKI